MIRTIVVAAGALLAIATERAAEACTCMPRTEQEQLEMNDIVFEGTIASIEPGGDNMERARFTIEEVVQGEVDSNSVIDYGTDTAACGLGKLEVGARYRMYVMTMNDNSLQANLCGGSTRLSPPPATGSSPEDNALPIAPTKRGCASCSSATGAPDAGVLLGLATLLALRRRRR